MGGDIPITSWAIATTPAISSLSPQHLSFSGQSSRVRALATNMPAFSMAMKHALAFVPPAVPPPSPPVGIQALPASISNNASSLPLLLCPLSSASPSSSSRPLWLPFPLSLPNRSMNNPQMKTVESSLCFSSCRRASTANLSPSQLLPPPLAPPVAGAVQTIGRSPGTRSNSLGANFSTRATRHASIRASCGAVCGMVEITVSTPSRARTRADWLSSAEHGLVYSTLTTLRRGRSSGCSCCVCERVRF